MTEQDKNFLAELLAHVLKKKDFYFQNLAQHFNVTVDEIFNELKNDALEIAEERIEEIKKSEYESLSFVNCFGIAIAEWLESDIKEETGISYRFESDLIADFNSVRFELSAPKAKGKGLEFLKQLKQGSFFDDDLKFSLKKKLELLKIDGD